MEEILASIRRIIADDQSLPAHNALRDPVSRESLELRQALEAREPLLSRELIDAAALPSVKEEAHPAPVHVLRPEPARAPPSVIPAARPDVAPEPQSVAIPTPAHGSVSATQLASPGGPESEAHRERGIASVAPQHLPPEPLDAPAPERFDLPLRATSETVEYEEPIGHQSGEPAADETSPATLLFSAATDSSLTSAFNMLAATRLADQSGELLAMSRDLIRPMLKAWLDDNLPSMVERLVRAEIERVSRGGR